MAAKIKIVFGIDTYKVMGMGFKFLSLGYQYNTESSQWWQSMAVVIIFGLLAFCGRILVGSPPGMTEEEQRDLEMALGEEEAAIFIERNKPAEYRRKWFPPY